LKLKLLCITAAMLTMAALFYGCGKGEKEAEIQKARERELSNFSEGRTPPPAPAPLPKDLVLSVPGYVKEKYHTVTMAVGDRKTKEVRRFKAAIGGTVKVPGTDYSLKIEAYIPNWFLQGNTVTSKNEKQDDPAVRAEIFEGHKQVFDGFLFQKNKTPSFITDRYVIGLMGAS